MKKIFLLKNLNSKGAVSILLVMSILSVILAIALGSSAITAIQTKTSLSSNDSVVAYYAAEAGAEYALFEVRKNSTVLTTTCYGGWVNMGNAKYCLIVSGAIGDGDLRVQSIGDYKSARRSVEISF